MISGGKTMGRREPQTLDVDRLRSIIRAIAEPKGMSLPKVLCEAGIESRIQPIRRFMSGMRTGRTKVAMTAFLVLCGLSIDESCYLCEGTLLG